MEGIEQTIIKKKKKRKAASDIYPTRIDNQSRIINYFRKQEPSPYIFMAFVLFNEQIESALPIIYHIFNDQTIYFPSFIVIFLRKRFFSLYLYIPPRLFSFFPLLNHYSPKILSSLYSKIFCPCKKGEKIGPIILRILIASLSG